MDADQARGGLSPKAQVLKDAERALRASAYYVMHGGSDEVLLAGATVMRLLVDQIRAMIAQGDRMAQAIDGLSVFGGPPFSAKDREEFLAEAVGAMRAWRGETER